MKSVKDSVVTRSSRIVGSIRRRPRLWWLVCVVVGIVRDQARTRISLAAAGVAFWLLIAIFPALLAAVSIFGLVIDPADVARDLDPQGEKQGPLTTALHEQLEQFVQNDTSTLSIGLIVSILVLLWTASALLYGASRAIRVVYDLPPVGYLRIRLQCVGGAAVMVVALGVVVVGFGEAARWIASGFGDFGAVAATLIEIPAQLVVLTLAFAALIRFSVGPVAPIRTLWPGTAMAAVGLQVVFRGFGPYVAAFGDKSEIYGAAAGVVVAMLLAWISSYVVLIAVVGNTVIEAIDLVGPDRVDPADWADVHDRQAAAYRERLGLIGRARRR